jgi:branched-chain amino acid transport system ATP-binding protein
LATPLAKEKRLDLPGILQEKRALADAIPLYCAMALLELRNFSCGYGEMVAVSGLSFALEAGQILALLGPNGAGKTSTILAIMGHVQIKAGTLSVDGRDINRTPALQRTELGLALVPEGRRLFSDLTVAENLRVGGYSRSRADEKRNLARVRPVPTPCRASRPAGRLSIGRRAADAGDRPRADVRAEAGAGR